MSFSPILLSPHQINNPKIAGAKAWGLCQLREKGFKVPAFFCLPVQSHLTYLALTPKQQFNFKGQLQKYITEYVATHFPHTLLFSTRSSALAEDGKNASYAGQFSTELRVPPEELADSVIRCWQASFGERVTTYQEKQGIAQDIPATGIIIQEMLTPELSGVAFSANPQGILNEAVIVCGNGTGENVVEDKTPTTTIYFNLHSKQSYFEQQTGAPILSDDLIIQLIESLEILSKEEPVDIEYAVQHGIVWFLQVRPITTLPAGPPVILDNSNIVESYGGLCLPLTISFASFVYTKVFEGLAARFLPPKLFHQYKPILGQMVNSANGRMYYQISNWYTILKFLPMQHKIIPVWQRMLGVQTKEYDEKANPLSILKKLQIHCKLLYSAFGIPKKMDALELDFTKAQQLFEKQMSPTLSARQLATLFEQIAEIVVENWDITLLNDMYAFVFTGLLEHSLKKSGIQNYKDFANQLLAGNEHMESMKPVQQAWVLAQQLKKDTSLHGRLSALQTNEETIAFLNSKDPFAPHIKNYLALYGDRSHDELKLETLTFRSAPLQFVQLLLAYADGAMAQPRSPKIEEQNLNWNQLSSFSKYFIQLFSKKARLGITHREASRLNRGRIFGMVRSIFIQMGAELQRNKLLVATNDVFYLTTEELFAFASGQNTGNDFSHLVSIRKQQYEGFSHLPAYSRLIFAQNVFNKQPNFAQNRKPTLQGNTLLGTPCSSGEVVGEVLVITTPVPASAAQGKILVTHTTDPGWVFLLAVAKGVVAEKGSLLSHTAIITRELGLPSVVGVEGATELLQTGDTIRLNGGNGTIEKI